MLYSTLFHPDTDQSETITIIGCGIAGAAIAYQLAKQSADMKKPIKIRVIEQAEEKLVPNPLSSSHGNARITRLATAEGPQYIPYAKRSQEIIQDLENETGEKLHIRSGGLIIGPNEANAWPMRSATYAQANNIDCSVMDNNQLAQYRALKVKDSEIAYFEPSMGMLIPTKCHQTLINLAKAQGVEFIFGEKYQGFDEKSFHTKSIVVHTNKEAYPTDKLIFSIGPWLQKELSEHLEKDISPQFSVHTCTMYTFKIDQQALAKYHPDNCPVLIWQTDKTEAFVFFPDVNSSGIVQFAIFPITDLHPSTLTPETVKQQSFLMSPEAVYEKYIRPHFEGISSQCEFVTNYPFTMNKHERFIYDSLPNHPNVKVVDVGSAHGYKHVFAFGEQVAQHILTGQSQLQVEKLFGEFFHEMQDTLKNKKTPT